MSGASESAPSAVFDAAIRATSPRLSLKPGLRAIKKTEGHGQIVAEDPKRLLGSAARVQVCRALRIQRPQPDAPAGEQPRDLRLLLLAPQVAGHFVGMAVRGQPTRHP